MVKGVNSHEIQEGKCILRDETSKEPSQAKGETGTDLVRCLNQKHGRKEPEQNLTARGVDLGSYWSRTAVLDTLRARTASPTTLSSCAFSHQFTHAEHSPGGQAPSVTVYVLRRV